MGKWKRFLNMILSAVVCLTLGLFSGKHVFAETVSEYPGGQVSGTTSDESVRSAKARKSNVKTEYFQKKTSMNQNRDSSFGRRKAFYWMRGPDDGTSAYFEDSG